MEAGQCGASCFCMKDIGVSVTCRPWHWKTNRKRTLRSSQDPSGIGGLHRTDLHKQAAGLEKQPRTGLHSRPGTPGRHRPTRRFLPISNTPDTSPTSPQMSLRTSGWRRVASSEVSFSKTAVLSGFRHSISHVFINRNIIFLYINTDAFLFFNIYPSFTKPESRGAEGMARQNKPFKKIPALSPTGCGG